VTTALTNFFKNENLAALRELALREVAESVDRTTAVRLPSADDHRPTDERVMVCFASQSPRGAALLRRGSRLAGRLNTDWYAVYVETPGETPTRIDSEAQRQLIAMRSMAQELGATVEQLQGHDVVKTLLDFARTHGVGHIVIGRSERPWWRRLVGRNTIDRLVHEARGIDLHIVSLDDREIER
jgi:two-component system sensor histidine kinase KdpD